MSDIDKQRIETALNHALMNELINMRDEGIITRSEVDFIYDRANFIITLPTRT